MKIWMGRLPKSACLLGFLLPSVAMALPAFPGAEGFGSETPGGRGGAIYIVENLNDSGPGSLREALEATGSRIVVFGVGGTITLNSPIEITQPYLTVAGQSAPGGGIQIRNNPDGSGGFRAGRTVDSFNSIEIATHDVVLRYLKIRPGPLTPNPRCTKLNAVSLPPREHGSTCVDANDIRAIKIKPKSYNIILDHLSLYYSSDEILNIKGARDLTIQWSIVAQAMNFVLYDGFAGKASAAWHSKGALIGGKDSAKGGDITGRISVHHNLWAHNYARNPEMSSYCFLPEFPERCVTDTVNNVVYNWEGFGSDFSNGLGHHFSNVVGNYYKAGPDINTGGGAFGGLRVHDWSEYSRFSLSSGALLEVFFSDNKRDWGSGGLDDVPIEVVQWNPLSSTWEKKNPHDYAVDTPYSTPAITSSSAESAYPEVLANAGAFQSVDSMGTWTGNRDERDAEVVSEVMAGTGKIIQNFSEFSGWPVINPGLPVLDTDQDGMPDAWEVLQCLDPGTANSAGDPDGDEYTNIEEYLNGTRVDGQCP